MNNDYVKFYGPMDGAWRFELIRIPPILDNLESTSDFNINQILELYNIKEYIDLDFVLPEWTKHQTDNYKSLCQREIPCIVAKFIKTLDDQNILLQYGEVDIDYTEDFWTLYAKYKIYQCISDKAFSLLLEQNHINMREILVHKEVVSAYGQTISDYLCKNTHSAEILMTEYLVKNEGRQKVFFPSQLTIEKKEKLLSDYIDLTDVNPNYLQLIQKSENNPKEFVISDKLKLKAKRAYDKWIKTNISQDKWQTSAIEVGFDRNVDVYTCSIKNNTTTYTYDPTWIDNNMDYPTLLNNFIFLFMYVDKTCRCSFVSLSSELDIFERELGIKGKKEYIKGENFRKKDYLSMLQVCAYHKYLKAKGIELEDIYKWFFETYLSEEFHADGFIYETANHAASIKEKCCSLLIQMDSIFKQFKMYCEDGKIDRELFEMSSEHIIISNIPSMIDKKYAYASSESLMKEMYLLYSDQSMMSYTKKTRSTYNTLPKLLLKEELHMDDFEVYQRRDMDFLIKRGVVKIAENGRLVINQQRAYVLYELYKNTLICYSYCDDQIKRIIDELVLTDEMEFSNNSLFSKPEYHYLNYMLNKHEYSNGCDLRNKYVHGSSPTDESTITTDYYELMKITAFIIIKINEEFCLKYNHTGNE